MATREIRTHSLGNLDTGDIRGNRDDGVFVVVSSRPANWRGEDRDVYAHIDTWYTIRDANEQETHLWDAVVKAAADRKALRTRLGAGRSHVYNQDSGRLVSTMTRLDSYDDRWNPPADIVLDAAGVTIEDAYMAALAALKGQA